MCREASYTSHQHRLCTYVLTYLLTYRVSPLRHFRQKERRNSLKLQQLGAQVKINVDTSKTPPRLQQDAEDAARSGSLLTHVCVPGHADIAISLWDELRTWDPGD